MVAVLGQRRLDTSGHGHHWQHSVRVNQKKIKVLWVSGWWRQDEALVCRTSLVWFPAVVGCWAPQPLVLPELFHTNLPPLLISENLCTALVLLLLMTNASPCGGSNPSTPRAEQVGLQPCMVTPWWQTRNDLTQMLAHCLADLILTAWSWCVVQLPEHYGACGGSGGWSRYTGQIRLSAGPSVWPLMYTVFEVYFKNELSQFITVSFVSPGPMFPVPFKSVFPPSSSLSAGCAAVCREDFLGRLVLEYINNKLAHSPCVLV